MQDVAIVTGGGAGLGQALAWQLAGRGLTVFIIDRHGNKLAETQRHAAQQIIPIIADISTVKGRNKISAILKGLKLRFLIHNAAIVYPIVPLEQITLQAWRKIQATNVEAPLFLTQQLSSQIQPGGRILHISSDCAHYPLAHWIPYCTSKASLAMLYQCLKKEFAAKNIAIGSVDPGMMDTPMQHYICDARITFPEKISLEKLQQDNLLFPPAFSADFCLRLLFDFSAEDFSVQEHIVRHHA